MVDTFTKKEKKRNQRMSESAKFPFNGNDLGCYGGRIHSAGARGALGSGSARTPDEPALLERQDICHVRLFHAQLFQLFLLAQLRERVGHLCLKHGKICVATLRCMLTHHDVCCRIMMCVAAL